MSSYIRHPFHLVDESPWPLVSAVRSLILVTGLVKAFFRKDWGLSLVGVVLILLVILQWWNDISHEATFQGHHSSIVELGLRWGMVLFITSEVFFFLSFFWAFFHSSLSPSPELGRVWPPVGVQAFSPFTVPLLNTIVLLSSGISVTWAHHALITGDHDSAFQGLLLTVILGLYFTALQAIEYFEARFRMADRVYGSSFFIATGFHGLHVIVGTTFLAVCLIRVASGHFSKSHHFGFEAAAWYWHFVDVVWLFLYVSIYWWGGA